MNDDFQRKVATSPAEPVNLASVDLTNLNVLINKRSYNKHSMT